MTTKINLSSSLLTNVLKGNTSLAAGKYSDERNLYLYVSSAGAMSWVFKYKPTGAKWNKELGLGSFIGAGRATRLSLAEARVAAQKVREQLAAGIDPVAAKAEAKAARTRPVVTFEMMLDALLTKLPERKGWKLTNGVYEQAVLWRNSLKHHCARLFPMAVNDITPAIVGEVLLPVWGKPKSNDLRHRIEQVLDHSTGHGQRKDMPNAAAWAGELKALLVAKPSKKARKDKGHAALPYAELPAFWQQLSASTSAVAPALAFTVLTAVRSGESRGALWEEIDLDAGLWTIPAERMKATVEHVVPLSTQAIALLKAQGPKASGLVFEGAKAGQPLSETAFGDLLTREPKRGGLNLKGKATAHGFRSTFSDWVGDETTFAKEDREFCLAHGLEAVEGAYRRTTAVEKRRAIMQAWADYAHGVEKVAQLRRAA